MGLGKSNPDMYLNVSEMGKGVFGIDAAAKHYFNKSKNLTRSNQP